MQSTPQNQGFPIKKVIIGIIAAAVIGVSIYYIVQATTGSSTSSSSTSSSTKDNSTSSSGKNNSITQNPITDITIVKQNSQNTSQDNSQ